MDDWDLYGVPLPPSIRRYITEEMVFVPSPMKNVLAIHNKYGEDYTLARLKDHNEMLKNFNHK